MNNPSPLKFGAVVGFLSSAFPVNADPVPVRHVQGYIHGFVVLKDLDDKVLASGDVTQTPGWESPHHDIEPSLQGRLALRGNVGIVAAEDISVTQLQTGPDGPLL
jgi:hypothetical protein